MPQPTTFTANAYPFSGLIFFEKFREENIKNYFEIHLWTLPEYKIYDSQTTKIKGDPIPYVVKNYDWSTISMDVFINSDYFEYKYVLRWLKEIQQNREYMYHKPGLLTNSSMLILNTKENKISLGLKFIDCYPEMAAAVTFQRDVTPLKFTLTLKYRDVIIIDDEEYEDVRISRI